MAVPTTLARLAQLTSALTVACVGAAAQSNAPSAPSAPSAASTPLVTSEASPAPPALSREDCLADLDELARRAAVEWSYADDKHEHFGVDLEALRAEAATSLGEHPTLEDFAYALRRFVAGMKDGHGSVALPGYSWKRSRVWPFTVANTAEGVLVDAVAEGTPDLRRGDKLLTADREPIEAYIADEMQLTFASTDGARRALAMAAMRRTDNEHVRCILQRPAGPLMELELDTLPLEREVQAPERPPQQTTHRRLDGDIGYLRIGSFAAPDGAAWSAATPDQWPTLIEPLVAAYRQAFAELADTRALLLDLRGNPGGTDLAAMEVARQLLPADAIYFQLQARLENGQWSPISSHRFSPGPAVTRYAQPLVVLIDERTFSTADNLAACLRDHLPEAHFVGRPSGGGTGAPRAITLAHSGAAVTFCTQRVYGPAGLLTEGRGVVPDVAVRWTRDDLLMARDPDLAAALALLGPAER